MEEFLVCEFQHSEDNNATYKLASIWRNDNHIHLTIMGLRTAWTYEITPRNCSSYLAKLGMHYEQYKSAFRKLFEPDDNELFKVVFDSGILKWTKVLSEQMSIMYGVFTFNHVTDSGEVVHLMEPFWNNLIKVREKVELFEQSYKKIKNELSLMTEHFHKSTEEKLEMENVLMVKFLEVMKKKDAMIEQLRAKLADPLHDLRGFQEDEADDMFMHPRPGTSRDLN